MQQGLLTGHNKGPRHNNGNCSRFQRAKPCSNRFWATGLLVTPEVSQAPRNDLPLLSPAASRWSRDLAGVTLRHRHGQNVTLLPVCVTFRQEAICVVCVVIHHSCCLISQSLPAATARPAKHVCSNTRVQRHTFCAKEHSRSSVGCGSQTKLCTNSCTS